jgi:hypothetical protein
MKKFQFTVFILFLLGFISSFNSQMSINNQKTFGGNLYDYGGSVFYSSDSLNIFIVGISNSTQGTGDRNAINYGFGDVWVLKLDLNYNIIWDKSYGGSGTEGAPNKAILLHDTIYIACISSSPISGNKTIDRIGDNYGDIWFLSLDLEGDILTQSVFGGDSKEELNGFIGLKNGNFLITCKTSSDISGNKTESLMGTSYQGWIIEVDKTGNLIQQRSIRHTSDNEILDAQQDSISEDIYISVYFDGDPIVNGDKTDVGYGLLDMWIIRFDKNLNKLSDKCFGGSDNDFCFSIKIVSDGILLCGASTSGVSGNKTASQQFPGNVKQDTWLIKTDLDFNIIYDKTYGGSNSDAGFKIVNGVNDRYALVCFSTSSNDGNKTTTSFSTSTTNPTSDLWIILIDGEGNILDQFSIGGSESEGFLSFPDVILTKTNDLLVLCSTESPVSGNLTAPKKGAYDMWLVELETTSVLEIKSKGELVSINLFPNPFHDYFNVELSSIEERTDIFIYSADGKVVYENTGIKSKHFNVDLANLENAIYFYKIISGANISMGTIMKQ